MWIELSFLCLLKKYPRSFSQWVPCIYIYNVDPLSFLNNNDSLKHHKFCTYFWKPSFWIEVISFFMNLIYLLSFVYHTLKYPYSAKRAEILINKWSHIILRFCFHEMKISSCFYNIKIIFPRLFDVRIFPHRMLFPQTCNHIIDPFLPPPPSFNNITIKYSNETLYIARIGGDIL